METATHVKPPCLSTFDVQQRCFHLGWDDFAANKGKAKGQMPVLMCRCRWHRPGIEGQVVNPTARLIHGMPGWISVVPAWSKDESDFMDFDGTFWGDIWNSWYSMVIVLRFLRSSWRWIYIWGMPCSRLVLFTCFDGDWCLNMAVKSCCCKQHIYIDIFMYL